MGTEHGNNAWKPSTFERVHSAQMREGADFRVPIVATDADGAGTVQIGCRRRHYRWITCALVA